MKKLKLDVEQVTVLSFDLGEKGRSGTVHAHTYTYDSGIECEPTGIQYSCYSCPAPPKCDLQPWSSYC
jgi:hypothetical protein